MRQYLEPFEILMLMMETSSKPMHAGGLEVFQLPKNAPPNFVARLAEQLRAVKPCAPFNQALSGIGWQHWKTAEVNTSYHVRHVSLPLPGTMKQLTEMTEGLYGSLLNRSMPLWEMWLIDGLEGDRFAILYKGHHALTDGMKGMNIHLSSFSTKPNDKKVRAPWGDNRGSAAIRRQPQPVPEKHVAANQSSTERLSLVNVLQALWPIKTRPMRLNGSPQTAERRFGGCQLPLVDIKRAGKEYGVSVNDVLVAVVDHATNRYLRKIGAPQKSPLAVVMPISTRKEGATGGASNQVSAVSALMGSPNATIDERLVQVRDSLKSGRTAFAELPAAAGMGYFVLLASIMPNLVGPAARMFASQNLMVSNITPPRGAYYVDHPLYRAGARLEAYYIQPILNAGSLLNVTVMCYNGALNVGIGSIPGAIDDPFLLGSYMVDALEELVAAAGISASGVAEISKPRRRSARPDAKTSTAKAKLKRLAAKPDVKSATGQTATLPGTKKALPKALPKARSSRASARLT